MTAKEFHEQFDKELRSFKKFTSKEWDEALSKEQEKLFTKIINEHYKSKLADPE